MMIIFVFVLYFLCIFKISVGSLTQNSNYITKISTLPVYNLHNEDSNNPQHFVGFHRLINLRGGKKASIFDQIYSIFKSFLRPFFPKLVSDKSTTETSRRYGTNKVKSNNKKVSSNNISGETTNRLQKEMKSFLESPPDNCQLIVGKNIRSWTVILTGVNGTIYEGEQFKLRMIFPKDYPSKPPSVFFLKPCPKHMHVYTNGDICLNFLGKDWRPTLTAETLAVSILSILSSAKEKTIPQDNALHADSQPGKQQEGWMYHDDRC